MRGGRRLAEEHGQYRQRRCAEVGQDGTVVVVRDTTDRDGLRLAPAPRRGAFLRAQVRLTGHLRKCTAGCIQFSYVRVLLLRGDLGYRAVTSARPARHREPLMTAKRILAAVLIALGLAAGAGAAAASGGTVTTASPPPSWYHA
jgi:hypothetical protein